MKRFSLFIAILCCAVTVSAAQYSGLKSITTGGKTRQYYLYVPNALKPNSPMIISCHGMNQDYNYQKTQTQLPSMADTASFVVGYPVGIAGSAWGTSYSTGWDIEGMTDVNFMLDIIDAVKADYDIDKTRVYLSGFSLGGTFVYHAINVAADKFAAFAPVSGYNPFNSPEPNSTASSRPVPIIHVHGDADNVMYYSGIEGYIKAWAQAEKCNMTPIETSGDGYTCTRYTDGDCETEVVLYAVSGRGHEQTDEGFPTCDAIWQFCRQYNTGCGKISPEGIESPSLQGRSGEASKFIQDGQLFILRGDKLFNAIGTQVK